MRGLYLVVLLLILPLSFAVDPSGVCLAPAFQVNYHNMITEDNGVLALNFGKEVLAMASEKSGVRIVHDFAKLEAYSISPDGTCYASQLPISRVLYQCLPPYAQLVTTTTGVMGYETYGKVSIQTWNIEVDYSSRYRLVLSTVSGKPSWPLMMQEFGFSGTTDMYLYTNIKNGITNAKIFDVPENCTIEETDTPLGG